MRARLSRRLISAAVAALLLTPAACSSGGKNDCSSSCHGTIHGSKYNIRVPKNWNGTLLIFSHGYVNPAGKAGPVPDISYEDNGFGEDAMSLTLLTKGYALAGSSYTGKGWVAADAVSADNDLYNKFVKLRGTPKRTIVWGASFGGMVTELVAEKYSWVDGALPICGALAGPILNFDNMLESAWLVKTLLDVPSLQLTNFKSQQQANAAALQANAAIGRAAADLTKGGAAKVALIGDILGLPRKWAGHATNRETDQFRSLTLALQSYTAFNFAARYDIEQRTGGNPSSTYLPTVPLSPAEDVEITALHGNATTLLNTVKNAKAVVADAAARRALEATGNPTGKLRVPTVTLHASADWLVMSPNENIFQNRVSMQRETARLVQLQVSPPPNVASPPYAVGHCIFSSEQVLGALNVLDQWVVTGKRSSGTAVISALGRDVTAGSALPVWPSGATH